MSSATITISYELNPPAQLVNETQGLTTSNMLRHVVQASSSEVGLEEYYAALRVAIAKAKDQLGNELTEWRDAVGKAESSKETSKMMKYDADEEQEQED